MRVDTVDELRTTDAGKQKKSQVYTGPRHDNHEEESLQTKVYLIGWMLNAQCVPPLKFRQ